MGWFDSSSKESKENVNTQTQIVEQEVAVDYHNYILYGLIIALVLAYILVWWCKLNYRTQKRLRAEVQELKKVTSTTPGQRL